MGERAEAGHGDLFQEQFHPLPEVALAKEGRGRDRAGSGGDPGHLDERVEVGLARAEATDDFRVHGLLAGEADAAHEPVDDGVEEEAGLQQLLGHERRPVGAAGVDELVEGDGLLAVAAHRLEDRGQQDDGRRRPNVAGVPAASESRKRACGATSSRRATSHGGASSGRAWRRSARSRTSPTPTRVSPKRKPRRSRTAMASGPARDAATQGHRPARRGRRDAGVTAGAERPA